MFNITTSKRYIIAVNDKYVLVKTSAQSSEQITIFLIKDYK